MISYEPEMIFVEGGTFRMGSNDGKNDEKPYPLPTK
jgi:formylglycine-generating enzyme required for sulfatase activity